jgi:hypothetical protein
VTIHTIYRLGIWLPIAIPLITVGLVHGLGVRAERGPLQDLIEILLYSLVYGGVPYTALAVWGTWWVGGRSESQIRYVMMRAPFLMVAVFVPVAVLTGIAVGQPSSFVALAVLGAIAIIPLGYAYVGLVVLIRQLLGPRAGVN